MRRISREQPKFDLIRLLDHYARRRRSTIHDQKTQDAFLADLKHDFLKHRDNPILIHGLHIQAMFAYVAAALGRCAVIKEEDSGEIYAVDPGMQSPDFRIVTIDGREFLIEVKNHHPSSPLADFTVTVEYLESLRRYASVFQRDLYIALYWSEWGLWCLINANRFDRVEIATASPSRTQRCGMRWLSWGMR